MERTFHLMGFVIILLSINRFTIENAYVAGQGSGGNVLAAPLCVVFLFLEFRSSWPSGRIFMALFFFVTVFVSYCIRGQRWIPVLYVGLIWRFILHLWSIY